MAKKQSYSLLSKSQTTEKRKQLTNNMPQKQLVVDFQIHEVTERVKKNPQIQYLLKLQICSQDYWQKLITVDGAIHKANQLHISQLASDAYF